MELTKEQRLTLHDAIVATFDVTELRPFLRLRLGDPWDEVSGSGLRSQVALDAMEYYERRYRIDELILALKDSRPRNPVFRRLAESIIVTPFTAPGAVELQRVVFRQAPFLDSAKWDADGAAAELPVCLIDITTESNERISGTGFLIAPSLVLTARHVVALVLKGAVPKNRVRIWFDRKYLRDGKTLNHGIEYGLADDAFRADDENLDFAVLQLNAEAGNEPLGARHAEPGAATRGWLRFPVPPVDLKVGAPLIILQHPEGDPLKRALDMRSVASIAPDHRSILHQTNTRPGSSGSPCFDASWRLVAMHRGAAEIHNQAVIMERIAEALCARGVDVGA